MSDEPKRIKRAPGFFDVGELTQPQRHERDLASYSHEQDLYKHIATLSTGAVVILTTFLDRLKGVPHWRPLVTVSLGAFGVSIVAVVWMQVLSVRGVSRHPDIAGSTKATLGAMFLILCGFGGFLLGVASLIAFGIRNF